MYFIPSLSCTFYRFFPSPVVFFTSYASSYGFPLDIFSFLFCSLCLTFNYFFWFSLFEFKKLLCHLCRNNYHIWRQSFLNIFSFKISCKGIMPNSSCSNCYITYFTLIRVDPFISYNISFHTVKYTNRIYILYRNITVF